MRYQESTADENEINTSDRETRYVRSVLEPENSPESLRKRYLTKAGKYFYRDHQNALAFEDKGGRITTRNEDPIVAASMVELAIAKGWKEMKVTGSNSFRQTIWLEAAKRGITVRGYQPRPQDELLLNEALGRSPQVRSFDALSQARSKAFTEQHRDDALREFPGLEKAYAGQTAIEQWIEAHILNPNKRQALRIAITLGMAKRLSRGEIPSSVVLPNLKGLDPQQANSIHKQAMVMGAIAGAKGYSQGVVRLVVAVAERIGRLLADKGIGIPEPMVYDRNAPPRVNTSLARNESDKPEIRRQPKIQPRR